MFQFRILIYYTCLKEYSSGAVLFTLFCLRFYRNTVIIFYVIHTGDKYEMYFVLQLAKNYRNKLKQCAILMMEVTNRIQPTHSFESLNKIIY